jgi:hypothetical protein
MKRVVEDRCWQDGAEPPNKALQALRTVWAQPHLSNIDIVMAPLQTLQNSSKNLQAQFNYL